MNIEWIGQGGLIINAGELKIVDYPDEFSKLCENVVIPNLYEVITI